MDTTVLNKENMFYVQNVITFETVACVQEEVMHLIQKNASLTAYAIDLKNVTQANSAALGLLVELKKYTIVHKKEIKFTNLPERLLSLAQVCGVAKWLELPHS